MVHPVFCKPLQDKYLKSTQGFKQETALAQRVAEWEEKIRPVLELQVRQYPLTHDTYIYIWNG